MPIFWCFSRVPKYELWFESTATHQKKACKSKDFQALIFPEYTLRYTLTY